MSDRIPLEDLFGDIIQKARQGLNFSQQDLAEKLDLTLKQIEAIESYRLIPERIYINRLARVLQLNPVRLGNIIKLKSINSFIKTVTDAFETHILYGKPGQANCYITVSKRIKSCVIIDPGVNINRITEIIKQIDCQPQAVLITHNHTDHTHNLNAIVELYNCEVYPDTISALELTALLPEIEIWKTPGHSDDSKCFLLPGSIFVGDLMFAGSIGRAKPKRWARHREFVNQVLTLENDTYIFPGHGPVTTVKTEKKINPFYELEAK